MSEKKKPKRKNIVRRFFSVLGPGFITGAADDDPSGIATYSIAGAQLGTSLLWTALATWPLMAAVQMMCARVGMVTGMGLIGALNKRFPKWLLVPGVFGLLVANTINVGADLSGIADAAEMLTGINWHIAVVIFGVGIAIATIQLRYHQIAGALKWLALALFAYVVVALVIRPAWPRILHDTFVPSASIGHDWWQNLVAI